ncbi:MAG: hypothetical protein OXU20_00515, partial [Myxococcales bacterium]|nr:hypothetical protein [Myxococcales bacterium]
MDIAGILARIRGTQAARLGILRLMVALAGAQGMGVGLLGCAVGDGSGEAERIAWMQAPQAVGADAPGAMATENGGQPMGQPAMVAVPAVAPPGFGGADSAQAGSGGDLGSDGDQVDSSEAPPAPGA